MYRVQELLGDGFENLDVGYIVSWEKMTLDIAMLDLVKDYIVDV